MFKLAPSNLSKMSLYHTVNFRIGSAFSKGLGYAFSEGLVPVPDPLHKYALLNKVIFSFLLDLLEKYGFTTCFIICNTFNI